MIYGIGFLTAFLSGTEIGFPLSVFLIPMTIFGIVHGARAPMPLAQIAMLLEMDFLGNPGHRFGTRMLLLFLALVRSFLGRFQLGLLMGTKAFNPLKRHEKQMQVHQRHTLLIRGSGSKSAIFSNGPNITFECFNLLY